MIARSLALVVVACFALASTGSARSAAEGAGDGPGPTAVLKCIGVIIVLHEGAKHPVTVEQPPECADARTAPLTIIQENQVN